MEQKEDVTRKKGRPIIKRTLEELEKIDARNREKQRIIMNERYRKKKEDKKDEIIKILNKSQLSPENWEIVKFEDLAMKNELGDHFECDISETINLETEVNSYSVVIPTIEINDKWNWEYTKDYHMKNCTLTDCKTPLRYLFSIKSKFNLESEIHKIGSSCITRISKVWGNLACRLTREYKERMKQNNKLAKIYNKRKQLNEQIEKDRLENEQKNKKLDSKIEEIRSYYTKKYINDIEKEFLIKMLTHKYPSEKQKDWEERLNNKIINHQNYV